MMLFSLLRRGLRLITNRKCVKTAIKMASSAPTPTGQMLSVATSPKVQKAARISTRAVRTLIRFTKI